MSSILLSQRKRVSTAKREFEKSSKAKVNSLMRYHQANNSYYQATLAYLLETADICQLTGKSVYFVNPISAGNPYALTFEKDHVIEHYSPAFRAEKASQAIISEKPVDYIRKRYASKSVSMKAVDSTKLETAIRQIERSGVGKEIKKSNVQTRLTELMDLLH